MFRDSVGKAHWRVLATLRLPRIEPGHQLVLGLCALNSQPDRSIVAIARADDDVEVWRVIGQAWRVNPAARRFESLPTAGITCENEGYGM